MKANEIYHALITNIEGAINNLDTQICKDLDEATTAYDIASLEEAHNLCKTLTWYKVKTMNLLTNTGLLKYGKEPF